MVRELIDKTWRPWPRRRRKKLDGAVYERDKHLVIVQSRLRKLTPKERRNREQRQW